MKELNIPSNPTREMMCGHLKNMALIPDYFLFNFPNGVTDKKRDIPKTTKKRGVYFHSLTANFPIQPNLTAAVQIWCDGAPYCIAAAQIACFVPKLIFPPESQVSLYYRVTNNVGGPVTYLLVANIYSFDTESMRSGTGIVNPPEGTIAW